MTRRWCSLYGHKWGGWRRDQENERVVEGRLTSPQTRRCRRCAEVARRPEGRGER